jgi:hypothetical protein
MAEWSVRLAAEFETDFARLERPVRIELLTQVAHLKAQAFERGKLPELVGSSHEGLRELRLDVPGGDWRVALAFDAPRDTLLLLACEPAALCPPGREWILSDKAERRMNAYFARMQPARRRAVG